MSFLQPELPTCFCDPGFTGDDCSETACIKSAPLDGSGGARMCGGIGQGVCVKSLCYCRAGFEPPFCNKQSCPNDCSGNGVCDEKGKCACDSGFGGDDCAEPSCCDPKCNGHGECQAGRCHCEGALSLFILYIVLIVIPHCQN